MKKVLASLCLLLGASSAFAQTSNTVRWQSFAGVITAQNVDNPVSASIHIPFLRKACDTLLDPGFLDDRNGRPEYFPHSSVLRREED
jgi:hypothetical protein